MTNTYQDGFLTAIESGIVAIPYALLRHYRQLGLQETEVMLLLQLLAFQEKEQNAFPTPDELHERMGLPMDALTDMLSRLVKQQWLYIEEQVDASSGIQFETYSLAPLYCKLADVLRAVPPSAGSGRQEAASSMAKTEPPPAAVNEHSIAAAEQRSKDIYFVFEKEFARPLSPMEGETISGWLDADGYPQELVLLALKEAVFAGKLSFRYIDRILLEWQRNRIQTVEQAKEFTKQFRSGR